MKFWLGIFFEMRILLPSCNWIDNLIYMPPNPPFVLIQSTTGGIHAEVDHLLKRFIFSKFADIKTLLHAPHAQFQIRNQWIFHLPFL